MSEGKLESMLLEAMEVYRSIREEVKDELTGAEHITDNIVKFHLVKGTDMLTENPKFYISLSINGKVIEAPPIQVTGYVTEGKTQWLYRKIEDSIMDILDKELRATMRKEFESSADLGRIMSAPQPTGDSL